MEGAAPQGRIQFRGGEMRVLCGMPHAGAPFCEVSLRLVRPSALLCGATPVGAVDARTRARRPRTRACTGPEFPRIEAC
ncbi:hypothetical protein GCM10010339_00550 [Streptomyces alanosinicus]|uniref:Uncharacterized protein n=1 Tax=Streptomyces alanosinicus TaxID=68171 RepID=A0A918YCN7_9ACTN|nr:hypothetical protein GCM10010339_00550 [Streptomyces alanosinicus]